MKHFAVNALVLLGAMVATTAQSFDQNGRPNCQTEKDITTGYFRNNWDPSFYWICYQIDAPAALMRCPSGTGFLESIRSCVNWEQWVWEEPIREHIEEYPDVETDLLLEDSSSNEFNYISFDAPISIDKHQGPQGHLHETESISNNVAAEIETVSRLPTINNVSAEDIKNNLEHEQVQIDADKENHKDAAVQVTNNDVENEIQNEIEKEENQNDDIQETQNGVSSQMTIDINPSPEITKLDFSDN